MRHEHGILAMFLILSVVSMKEPNDSLINGYSEGYEDIKKLKPFDEYDEDLESIINGFEQFEFGKSRDEFEERSNLPYEYPKLKTVSDCSSTLNADVDDSIKLNSQHHKPSLKSKPQARLKRMGKSSENRILRQSPYPTGK